MTYKYLEHEADIGIMATGATIEEAFQDGAKAMFNVMFDTTLIEEKDEIPIYAEADDIAALFVEVLNEMLFKQDTDAIAFSRFLVKEIKKEGDTYQLNGIAYGEPLNLQKHDVKTEVKAATYSGLKFEREDGNYVLQCVLDV
ncbi:MAG: archease [Deltaproteobacteria bacterium]|nr:archease [Deltaproteobacteria bacterium]